MNMIPGLPQNPEIKLPIDIVASQGTVLIPKWL